MHNVPYNDSGNTAQKSATGKRTSSWARTGTYTIYRAQLQILSPPSPFCTSPRFEPETGTKRRWVVLSPYCHSSEQCFQNHYSSLATPAHAYTELPTCIMYDAWYCYLLNFVLCIIIAHVSSCVYLPFLCMQHM